MAKEKKTKEQLEIEKREQEEEALRQKELKKEQKEKEAKAKAREKRRQKKIKDEEKRIKGLVNFPFKLLWHLTSLITVFAFLIIYFVAEVEIYKTLLWTFFIFTFLYLGGGGVMVGYFLLLSIERKKELEELVRIEEEEKILEEKMRHEQEIAELEAIERDLAVKRNTRQSINELPANNSQHNASFDDFDGEQLLGDKNLDDLDLPDIENTTIGNSSDEDSYLDELLASEFETK